MIRTIGRSAVVFDLDSTICDTRDRHHLIGRGPERARTDWVAYSMACLDDIPIEANIALLRMLYTHKMVVLCSGRSEKATDLTTDWLTRNRVPYDRLILRPNNIRTGNDVFKADTVRRLRAEGWRVDLVVDDWPPVALACAKLGVPTLLVQPPDYPTQVEDKELEDANLV